MTCPLCKKPAHPDYRPFCGRAHRDRDLLQWLGESYRIPGRPIVDEDADDLGPGLDTPGRSD